MIRLAQTPAEDGMPIVDREAVLSYTNIPDKQKVLQRFQELVNGQVEANQELDAQEQEMQQQAPQEPQMNEQMLMEVIEMIQQDPELLELVLQPFLSQQAPPQAQPPIQPGMPPAMPPQGENVIPMPGIPNIPPGL